MIRFDLSGLLKRFPDVSHDQLVCLLILRGEIQKEDAIEMATERLSALSFYHAKYHFLMIAKRPDLGLKFFESMFETKS